MSPAKLVCFLGLSADERETIAACLRLTPSREPHYELTHVFDGARCVIADAEHAPSVHLVQMAERLKDTVFVGATAPDGARSLVPRPIDPGHVLRELDRLLGATPPEPLPFVPKAVAPTALLVDDSEIALRFLELRLKHWGLVTQRAFNSGHALELLAQRHYDFVFLDVELGSSSEMDGLSLCQHIKRQQDKLVIASAVFLVSAHASDVDRVHATLAGCDAFLGKPLSEEELARVLTKHGLSRVNAPNAPTAA